MIVRMKHLDLICLASDKERTLEGLRELGVMHLDLGAAVGGAIPEAKGTIADAEKAVRAILKARGKTARGDINLHERAVADVLGFIEDRERLTAEAERLERLIRIYEPYGDFDPELAAKLLAKGVEIGELLPKQLPEMRLSRMEEKLERVRNRHRIDDAKLAGTDEQMILRRFPELQDRLAFEQARELLAEHGQLAVISGWIAESMVAALMEAKATGWGVLVRDPAAGETPPTLIKPPKLFRPVKALFAGLGIAPAYDEADVSVPFLCYFSLFFAMLVGDGAYGVIFLLLTLMLRRKLPKAWFTMLMVFSSATIVWGVLSNTWFAASIPWCANWPTVRWLSGVDAPTGHQYDAMMLLCFTIGVSHLMLARIWNGICRLNDTTSVAEFGWAGILLFMYLVTNSIVGIFPGVPTWGFYLLGASLVAVFGFSVKPSELRTKGAELGMLPLSIMSALGDIISYVRLFAVGLASVKVAENFNSMALDLLNKTDDWLLKALLAAGMVAILVFGHLLNLAMAGLSILVHAVRLNTLEFSNHKGVSWAGYAFKPFKKGGITHE